MRIAASLGAALVLVSSPEARSAPPRSQSSLDDAIRAADLVFEGTIQAVEFRNARGVGGKPGIPHTFVTWQIHQVFKGRTPRPFITARFLGGMPNADELLALSNAPRPDVGDRDVVFLRENGRSICPLVGCEDGRLRIVGGAVFSESGQALSVRPDASIQFGAASDDPGFARWERVGIERVRGGVEVDADSVPGTATPDTTPAISAATLRSILEARVDALFTPAEQAQLRPVKSLDPEKPFSFRSPRAVSPAPKPAEDGTEPAAEGSSDPAELAAYLANGSNPVLPR